MDRDKIHQVVDSVYESLLEKHNQDIKERIDKMLKSGKDGKIDVTEFVGKYAIILYGATMNFTATLLGEVLADLFPDESPNS